MTPEEQPEIQPEVQPADQPWIQITNDVNLEGWEFRVLQDHVIVRRMADQFGPKITHNNRRYYQVRMGRFMRFIHRIVATQLLPNPHNYKIVHHLDHNKRNNHPSNLVWCSPNQHRAYHMTR
jgi:hypothetical protein